jgi:hypothetical protein
MKKLMMAILLMPIFVSAGFTTGYSVLDLDLGDGDSISLGALNAAYTWEGDSPFSTQAGVLIGIQDDKFEGVTLELDPSFYLKGMYNLNENFFIAATWTKFEAEASAGSISESASDSEMGLGIGFNAGKFRFIFDHVDDTDIFSIQYSF